MDITTGRDGDQLKVQVKGSINTVTATEFEQQVLTTVAKGGTALVLDFSEVDYVSSAGLRSLLKIDQDKPAEMSMTIVGVNDEVREVFEMTGFDQLLELA